MGNVEGLETRHMLFVQAQKPPAGREIIVHNIEDFPVDAPFQPGQDNGFGTVVHVGKWNCVGAAHMQEYSKRSDTHPVADSLIAGAVDITRSDNDVWDAKLLRVLDDDLILLYLGEGIGIPAQFRMVLDWT